MTDTKSETKPASTAAPASSNEAFERLRQEHTKCVANIQSLQTAKDNEVAAKVQQAEQLEAAAAKLRNEAQQGNPVFDVLLAAENRKREYLEAEGNKLIEA